jgi:signal transduction histidine kinase/HAMP domain-containing protein
MVSGSRPKIDKAEVAEPLAPVAAGWGSIRLRIAVAFVATLLTMVLLLVALAAWQAPVSEALRQVTEGYLPLSKQAALLRQDHARLKRDLMRFSRARARSAESGDEAEIYTEQLQDNLEIARVVAVHQRSVARRGDDVDALGQVLTLLDGIDGLFQRYDADAAELQAKVDALDEEALDAERRKLRATEKLLEEELDALEATLERRISALTTVSEQLQDRARGVAAALLVGSTLVVSALLGAVLLSLRGISRLTEEAARMAAGDYSRRVEESRRDEVGILAGEFNAMARAIELRDRRLSERAGELSRLSSYLGSVVDALDDGLLVTEDRKVQLANAAARRQWGAVVDWPVPAALSAVLVPGDHDLRGPDGQRFTASSVPFGASGAVTVLTDVTERVRAQERLARSERLAIIGQMLAQITHEIRNPLNALSLNVELLGDEIAALDPSGRTEAEDLLRLVAREVERLTALSGHYLALARRPVPVAVPCDLDAVVDDTLALLEPELRAAGVQVARERGEAVVVGADPDQLRQALLNVVRNAVQAAARTLHLSVGADAREAWVVLADDGVGMDADTARHAAEPFYSTKATGTGLGLAITRQILEDHEGRVEVNSAVGAGTRVALFLPCRPRRDGVPSADHEGATT